MVAQKMPQTALSRVTLNQQLVKLRLGPRTLRTRLLQLTLRLLAFTLALVMLTAHCVLHCSRSFLLFLGLVDTGLGLLGLAQFLGGLNVMGQLRLEFGKPYSPLFQTIAIAVVQCLAAGLVVGLQSPLLLAVSLAAGVFFLGKGIDQGLDLFAVALQQIPQLNQTGIQAGLALPRRLLQLLQVITQLLLLLAPLRQRLKITFE